MNTSFIHSTNAVFLSIYLFLGMLVTFYVGNMFNKYWQKNMELSKGLGVFETSIFASLGFMLAFAFGMSGSRYDGVRNIFVDEANEIGTAVLRADLYPDSVRTGFRQDFREYVEARVALYSNITGGDTSGYGQRKKNLEKISGKLWQRATDQSKLPNMLIPTNLMVPALNGMFDIAEKRDIVLRTQVPDLVVIMLFVLAMVSTFISGLNSSSVIRSKDIILILCYAFFTAMIVYITLDLGRPLRGAIRAETGEQAIKELMAMFPEGK